MSSVIIETPVEIVATLVLCPMTPSLVSYGFACFPLNTAVVSSDKAYGYPRLE